MHDMGDGTYVMIISPAIEADLRDLRARAAWHEIEHRRRWERRFGMPYPEPVVVLGQCLGGLRINCISRSSWTAAHRATRPGARSSTR